MPEVVGPSPQERVDPLQEGGECQVLRSLRQRPHPTADSQDGFLGRVRIDVALVSASLLLTLDVPAQEVVVLTRSGGRFS